MRCTIIYCMATLCFLSCSYIHTSAGDGLAARCRSARCAAAIDSAVAKVGLALFDEGGHTFLLVIEREGRMKSAALEQQAFVER